jgi:predicted RNase H-like HicB family nuclease
MSQLKYRVNIIWSEEDEAYLVELPEFATDIQRYFTHGDT